MGMDDMRTAHREGCLVQPKAAHPQFLLLSQGRPTAPNRGTSAGEQRTPLKGCVRVRSRNTAEQCSPMFAVRQNVRLEGRTALLALLSSNASVLIENEFAGAISKARICRKNATCVAREALKDHLIRLLALDGARAQVSTSTDKPALR